MKRVLYSILALVLCLGAAQIILAQKSAQEGKKAKQPDVDASLRPIDDCIDCCPGCNPEPTPTPPPCSNPIDDATFFVNQQYRDFLYRDATGAELINDLPPLNSCLHAGNFACYNTERVKMSRRMWDKPEFRQQSRTFGLPLTNGLEHYNNDDFVELEYLIYLQRPSSAPPDDYRRLGYFFWLGSLNNCVANAANFDQSSQCYNDSINAFLSSTEYRARFGCT
jgi:hypothetical protein